MPKMPICHVFILLNDTINLQKKKGSKYVTFIADHCNILCSQMIITNFTTILNNQQLMHSQYNIY